jgi:hypothetical protein
VNIPLSSGSKSSSRHEVKETSSIAYLRDRLPHQSWVNILETLKMVVLTIRRLILRVVDLWLMVGKAFKGSVLMSGILREWGMITGNNMMTRRKEHQQE